jgi:hypothetical protein
MKQKHTPDLYRYGWRCGTLMAGYLAYDDYYDGCWKIEDPTVLHIRLGDTTEPLGEVGEPERFMDVTGFMYRSKTMGVRGCSLASFKNHYAAIATDPDDCLKAISKRNSPLDGNKPVLCYYGSGQMAAFRVRPGSRRCVGAIYRLFPDIPMVRPRWPLSRSEEQLRRDEINRQEEAQNRFLTNPFDFGWGQPELLLWKNGRCIKYQPDMCGLDGLLPMPTPSEEVNIIRSNPELRRI